MAEGQVYTREGHVYSLLSETNITISGHIPPSAKQSPPLDTENSSAGLVDPHGPNQFVNLLKHSHKIHFLILGGMPFQSYLNVA